MMPKLILVLAALAASYTFYGTRCADAEVVKPVGSTITLHISPSPTTSLMLFKNGLFQTQGNDYTLSANTVKLIVPPVSTDAYIAFYRY